MTPLLAQLPQEVQENLSAVLPLNWNGVDVRVQNLSGLESSVPQSKVWSGVQYVVGRLRGSLGSKGKLKIVGATIGQRIYIDPEFAEWNTASGLALLAHERLHVEQERTIPNFEELYARAQQGVSPGRPWENPYEYDAYCLEAKVFYRLIERGMAPGRWTPLGVSMGFCGN